MQRQGTAEEKGPLTGNDGTELQGGGGGALEQLDGDGAGVGRGVVPVDHVAGAGGDDLGLGGGGDGVEAGGLGHDGGDEGQEARGGEGDLHLDGFGSCLF